jgi:hypothetical protein
MGSESPAGTLTTNHLGEGSDEAALREVLERVVRDCFGSRTTLKRITRASLLSGTSFKTYVVGVSLASGGDLRFFLKDLTVSHIPKQGLEERRNREWRMYRDLLREAGLGTARYYDSVWDESLGRFWLLLEFVPGERLHKQRSEYWLEAAAWLAKFHAHFQGHARSGLDFLIRHDAPFFWPKAQLALEEVSQFAGASVGKLEILLRCYDRVVDRLTSAPTTLLHGSFRSYNILVERYVQPPRICPVDWEGAALGTPLFDLGYLAHKLEPDQMDQMLEAYRNAALTEGVHLPDLQEMRRQLECVHFYMIVDKLSRARAKRYSSETVAKRLGRLEKIQTEIFP